MEVPESSVEQEAAPILSKSHERTSSQLSDLSSVQSLPIPVLIAKTPALPGSGAHLAAEESRRPLIFL